MGEEEKLQTSLEAESTHFKESIKKQNKKWKSPRGSPLLQTGVEFCLSAKMQSYFVYLTRSLREGILMIPK